MKKKITYLNNYMFSISESSPVFINKELYEQLTKKPFIDSFSSYQENIYSFGHIDKDDGIAIVPFQKIVDNNIIVKNNFKMMLGNKNHNYELFEIAVDENMPIIYDWVIGSTRSQKKHYDKSYKPLEPIIDKELIISCVCLINGKFKYIQDKIIGQDLFNCRLKLENLGNAFMVWGSYNSYQRILLENSKYQYEQIDKLYRIIMKGASVDLEEHADLITKWVKIKSEYFTLPKERIAPHLKPLFEKDKQFTLK